MTTIGKGITMDHDWAKPWEQSGRVGDVPAGFTLPSRVAALNALVPALRSQSGLVLVTGDAGVGKTWLRGRIQAELPTSWRAISIDLSPANDPAEFYRLIGHSLGLNEAKGLAAARVELADFLKENAVDGISWVLAIEEAHGLSLEVLEEIRLLSNRLGGSDGFAGLILVGQTALARRLSSRALAALAGRIAARAHLRSLDIEETQALVERIAPSLAGASEALEFLHRETGGNPKRILGSARFQRSIAPPSRAKVAPIEALPKASDEPRQPAAPTPVALAETQERESWDGPVLGQGKPPLRVEDGLIEVGWEPESESEDHLDEEGYESDSPSETHQNAAPLSEEAIHDRYAALQAWNEWSRNQGRATAVEPTEPPDERSGPADEYDEELAEAPSELAATSPGVRAEGQQNFAPYSQLFTRLKQRRDPS
ncbi:type II secretory pathway, component ExeA (predicted ATPase) [Singulisphaera acidiphila DSM 18658]|uniref:Type II secretory pathway, component ExeA (Predicted ATPase) n=2 Tax=Singulisphaera acidiphila TaxID=466153 RepID=L0D9D3_SINAD|nr:type II secretory pathway, component ExeA (predicted ATPase) [Singulisphaera acidiphila DSM 18658]